MCCRDKTSEEHRLIRRWFFPSDSSEFCRFFDFVLLNHKTKGFLAVLLELWCFRKKNAIRITRVRLYSFLPLAQSCVFLHKHHTNCWFWHNLASEHRHNCDANHQCEMTPSSASLVRHSHWVDRFSSTRRQKPLRRFHTNTCYFALANARWALFQRSKKINDPSRFCCAVISLLYKCNARWPTQQASTTPQINAVRLGVRKPKLCPRNFISHNDDITKSRLKFINLGWASHEKSLKHLLYIAGVV